MQGFILKNGFMNWLIMIMIPVISAFIGWIPIWIAIKMLFHPKKPVRILGFTIQGIFPRRQPQFAQQAGALVSNELVSFPEIEATITNEENVKKIMPLAEIHIDDFLRNKLKDAFPMIGMLIGEKTIGTLKTIFMNELETIFPIIIKGYVQNLQNDLDLENMVAEKIAALSSDKLEASLYQALSKELRLIQIFGVVLGFLIGLIQVFIIMAFS
jgi:uncharacterized membrane protein YheB (UPF0754 family)